MAGELGFSKVINDGNGNTLIFTALLAGAIANTLPTPFDSIYFRRINKLERDFDDGLITAETLEWHVAAEYYVWTTLWYVTLFGIIYSLGGKYKNNMRILLVLIAGGLVIGAVQKNIEYDYQVQQRKQQKNTLTLQSNSQTQTQIQPPIQLPTISTDTSAKYLMLGTAIAATVVGVILLYKAFKK